MLRAHWREHTRPYVCTLCRHRLIIRTTPVSTEPRIAAPGLAHARHLSISRALRNANEDGNPSVASRFPGGFAGGGQSAFGGFGVAKKDSPDGKTQLEDGLLPHERQARAKTNVASPPPPPPRTREGVRRGPSARQAAPQSKEQQAQAEKSRSLLKNIFDSAQRRRNPPRAPPGTPSQHGSASGGNASLFQNVLDLANKSAPASRDSSGWGGFSNRKAQIKTGETGAPKREGPKPTQREQRSSGASPRLTGQDAFNAMQSSRRDRKTESKSSPVAQDFWGELEERVDSYQGKLKAAAANPVVIGQWTPNKTSAGSDPEPSRKSRFDDDYSTRRREKKTKTRRSGERYQDHQDDDGDWGEELDERWEQKQRRKEERRAEKQEKQEAVPVFLPEYINVFHLGQTLKQKTSSFLADLEEMGFEDMNVDTIIAGDTAALIAMEYGFEPTVDTGSTRDLRPRPIPDDVSALSPRPPIVTIMGHVDHGKTTLLDWLRKASVVSQEHGGITQHIGAFVVKMSSGKSITFLDTPGHAAFLTMRQRGANITDIVVLVVAADDSVKPQTLEALKHAQAAKVPIIVAINKIDKEDARVDQVKADLSRHGVEIEDYGGDVQVVPVSGKTGQGMADLEENIATLSEILDVRAEPDGLAEGWVLESSVKPYGKAATILVKRGTIRRGDLIVAGKTWARIRWLQNEAGAEVREAPPGTPVEVLGWRDLPDAGEQILQAPDEDKAKEAVDYRKEMAEIQQRSIYLAEQQERQKEKEAAEAAAELAASEGSELENDPEKPQVITQNYIVKADVAGSVEAVSGSIIGLGNHEVQANVMVSGVGQITETDVERAAISKGIIVNFNVPIHPHIQHRAEEAGVKILDHRVIYHVVDDVRSTLADLLPPAITHRVQGEADILQIFSINLKKRMQKNIAGCRIRNGSIKKTSGVKVIRRGKVIYEGTIDTLKHVKKDVMEMGKGSECGIGLENFDDLRVDDQIQTFEVIKEKRKL